MFSDDIKNKGEFSGIKSCWPYYIVQVLTDSKHNNNNNNNNNNMSRESAVGIGTDYWLDDRGVGVRVLVGSRIFTSLCRRDRLCGPPNLLSNGYRGFLPRGLSGRGVKLTTHLQLVSRSRKYGSIHPLPTRLHGVVLN
jgi:hypothetical protein